MKDLLPEEEHRLLRLKLQELHTEQSQSNPASAWQKEKEWVDFVAGGPIDDDKARLFRAWGYHWPEDEFGKYTEPVKGCEQEEEGGGKGIKEVGENGLTEEREACLT